MTPFEVEQLVKEYLALSALAPEKVDIARLNKVKELLGEAGAEREVANKYRRKILTQVSVPRRGSAGAQILDILYRLDDGTFVLVEAKGWGSQLGRTNDRHVYRVGVAGGQVERTPLPLKRQIQQLDALWITDRFAEIEKTDPALANRLRDAVRDGQLHVLEVRTTLVVDGAGGTRLASEITDHTDRFREQARSGRRFTDEERRLARREALGAQQLEAAEDRVAEDRKAARQAETKANRAEGSVETAKKNLAKAQKPETKEKRTAIVAEKDELAKDLRAGARDAKETAKRSEQVRKLTEQQMRNDTSLRKAAEAEKRLNRPPSGVTGARATETTAVDRAVAGRMTEAREVAGAATDTAVVRRGGNEIAGRVAPQRAIFLVGRRGATVAVRTVRFLLTVVDFANPVFDLLFAVELVDLLVGWLRREQVEDQREWARISDFLFAPSAYVKSPYGIGYTTSIRDSVNSAVEDQLANVAYDRNFLAWLTKWNTDHTWRGFVYSQIDIGLHRQEEDEETPFHVKYYPEAAPAITFVDKPLANARTQTTLGLAGPQDPKNRSTGGGPAGYDPEHNISVQMSQVRVRFTHPAPTLTPFDFMIVKCRHLIAEVATFIAAYDDTIVAGMNLRDEIPGGLGKIYWLDGHPFPAPLNGPAIQFCLKSIYWVADNLSVHAHLQNDFARRERTDRFTIGFYRRQQILFELSRRRPMRKVADSLTSIARATTSTPGILEDLDYLRELAASIDDDLVRTFAACSRSPTSLEYNYQGRDAG